jgi:hypothetical protein
MPELKPVASTICSLLLIILMTGTGIGFAQEPNKRVLRGLNPIHSLARIVDLTKYRNDETVTRFRAVLRNRQTMTKSGQLERFATQDEPQSVLAIDSPNALLVAVPVAYPQGKLLRDPVDGSQTVQFKMLSSDRTLEVEVTSAPSNEELSKLVSRDSDTGQGLELNLVDSKVNELTSSFTFLRLPPLISRPKARTQNEHN